MAFSLYLDTNAFVSAFEVTDLRADSLLSVFAAIEAREFRALTSEMTLAELLPKPLSLGQTSLVDFYTDLLSERGPVEVAPVTRTVLLAAATLRGRYSPLKLPDAVHLSTALQERCAAILSNDRRLPVQDKLAVIPLSPHTLDDLRRLAA